MLLFKAVGYLSSFLVFWDGGKIRIDGSLNTFLFAIFFSKVNNRDGSKIKFDTIAKRSVTETKPPKAIVPPKLDKVNTRNPKNNTIEV